MSRLEPELTVLFLHLIARGRNRRKVFRCDADRWDYLNALREHAQRLGVKILAWALLGNHVHLLVACSDRATASDLLRRVNRTHAVRFNQRHGRSGQVWSTGPKKEEVCFEDYFRNCQIYIDLNPLRAKQTDRPEAYSWSSCRFYCTGRKDGLTTPSPWYLELGRTDRERRLAYRTLLDCARGNDIP